MSVSIERALVGFTLCSIFLILLLIAFARDKLEVKGKPMSTKQFLKMYSFWVAIYVLMFYSLFNKMSN